MTVEDLIQELERYPSDYEVYVHELGSKKIRPVELTKIHEVDKYSSRRRMMICYKPKEEKNEGEASKGTEEADAGGNTGPR